MGVRAAGLSDLAGLAGAPATDTDGLADADRSAGLLPDGTFAAGNGPRPWAGADAGLADRGDPVRHAGAASRAAIAGRGPRKRHGHPPGQLERADPQHYRVLAAIWGGGLDRDETGTASCRGD